MDIYTTSLTLPRNPALYDFFATPTLDSTSPGGAQSTNASSSRKSRSSVSSSTDGKAVESTGPSESSSAAATVTSPTTTVADASSTAATSTNGDTAPDGDANQPGASLPPSGPSSVRRQSVDLNDQIHRVCVDAMATNQCIVSFNPVDPPNDALPHSRHPTSSSQSGPNQPSMSSKRYNFHISGGYQQVMSARGHLLREQPLKRKSVVKVPRNEVLDGRENVKIEMRRKLDEIASLTRAHLAIVGQVSNAIGFGLETERNVEIVITGPYENVEQARVRLLVLLDELSGLHSEVCEIDYKLHNIISGRKRCVIQTIQEETGTNIYFPTPFSGIIGQKNPALASKQNLIFITGEFFGVQRAREMLFQVSVHKSKCIISRDTAILPRKLDWMLMDRLDDLRQIMNDNGTFINFPPIGSQVSLISVYGDHRVTIERSIRAVMHLACQFYVASFWLLPVSFDVFMPPATISPAQIPPILRQIAVTSGAEAVFKSNCFEFHGLESEVRTAVQMVLEIDFVKQFHHEIRFQIELANEHREFISGKKNGKLNKIMKSANVKIKFETFNDYNFLIDVAGNDTGALVGLTMLQEELPAEISFHVPEAYHKRIIGVAGRNIQRIMKNYGVYVKFSNAEEFAALGGYADNEDNVIARTPAKNAINLDHLKQAVMELVPPRDKDFVVETVSVPRRYHRTLLGEKSIFIHDIEAKTNSSVRFPNKELASDVVAIFGPESQVHIAAQMLLDHVPFEAEFRVPHSNELASLTLSQDWVTLTERIKHDLNITILPWVDRSGAGDETIIRFCLNRSNSDFLATARDLVEEYLIQREIKLYPGSLRPRSDSFSDAFPFFNSKLLSTGFNDPERNDPRQDRSKLRMAASTPDIKAIFNASGQTFNYRDALGHVPVAPQQQPIPSMFPPLAGTSQHLPPGSGPFGPPHLPLHAGYHWGPPRQAPPTINTMQHAPQQPIGSPTHAPPQAARHSLDSSITAEIPQTAAGEPSSVSVETETEDNQQTKVPARQQRTFAGRAQSLDLSAHTTPRRTLRHHPQQSIDHVGKSLSNLGL